MNLTLKHAIAAIILVLGFATPVVARPLEDGDLAIKRHDYATALRLIRPLAEQGNANAQYILGVFYNNGLGVPQDYVRSYMWLNLAATQGFCRCADLNFGRSDRSWSSPQADRDKRDNRLLRDCLTTKCAARRFGSKEKSESSGIRTESSQLELLKLMELMFPVTWLPRRNS